MELKLEVSLLQSIIVDSITLLCIDRPHGSNKRLGLVISVQTNSYNLPINTSMFIVV